MFSSGDVRERFLRRRIIPVFANAKTHKSMSMRLWSKRQLSLVFILISIPYFYFSIS